MNVITRRTLLRGMATTLAAGTVPMALGQEKQPSPDGKGCTFSFGTYGMKSLKVEDAIKLVADVGYDGIEIAARPDWDSAPARMPAERRRTVRGLLEDSGLTLPALMEHMPPAPDPQEHAAHLERLKTAAELGHDLSPNAPPLIQTVLGGGNWEECKLWIRDALADWADVAKESGTVIAVKPHRGGVMSRPSEAVWIIKQLDETPWLRMVYDYSHYAFRDMPLEETVETALPYIAHVAVKDAVQENGKVAFKLPGESGAFDYAKLFRLLYEGGYRGDICCEVSGMVWNQPGYDPAQAAKTCYANLAPAFEQAGVPRRG